jgi:hypothetical protein
MIDNNNNNSNMGYSFITIFSMIIDKDKIFIHIHKT